MLQLPLTDPRSHGADPLKPRRLPFSLTVTLAVSAALVGLLAIGVFFGGAVPTAGPHPEFAPMLRATPEGGPPPWTGWVVSFLVVGVLGGLISLGIRPRARRLRRIVWGWTAAYAVVFGALMRSADAYAAGSMTMFGGFPAPTAWLVYGVGFFPVLLLAFLVRRFETAFWDASDQARFERILREAADPDAGNETPGASGE